MKTAIIKLLSLVLIIFNHVIQGMEATTVTEKKASESFFLRNCRPYSIKVETKTFDENKKNFSITLHETIIQPNNWGYLPYKIETKYFNRDNIFPCAAPPSLKNLCLYLVKTNELNIDLDELDIFFEEKKGNKNEEEL